MAQFLYQYWTRLSSYQPWIVLVELLLIGLVVHAIIWFLRGTRGARVIKGTILFLALLYVVIELSGDRLNRVEFVYSRLLLFMSLATVVVFQPELRRALTRLGETRLFKSVPNPSRSIVPVLVKHAQYCARNRIGSLVAIERGVGLGTLVESGTQINAQLTEELLNTIFWPGSILHDMGVVIRSGKVSAAGVQFPLSDDAELPQELGSRHRAALGLSEESDALVIVVSEETGIISVADNGHLIRQLSPETLEALLLERLDSSGQALLGRHTDPAGKTDDSQAAA
jgi:diadenylate cyclase